MLYYVLGVVMGLGLLVWGADRFILGAAATARCEPVTEVARVATEVLESEDAKA